MSELKRILYGSHVCVTSRYQAKVGFSSWEGVNVGIGANIGNRSIFFQPLWRLNWGMKDKLTK